MNIADGVYIGIKGHVVALDRSTGQGVWKTKIRGSGFVNLVLDGDRILASAAGEIFCLDAITGAHLWRNQLSGMGTGLVSIATAIAPAGTVVNQASRYQAEQAAADAAAITGSM